jgi:ATP-dependent Zn protease
MNISREDNRVRIAHHEAGHAIVAWALGLGIKEVRINEKGGYSDHVRQYDDLVADHGQEEACIRKALVQRAGQAAQEHWRSEVGSFGCKHDRAGYLFFVSKLCGLNRENDTNVRNQLVDQVNNLVNTHWPLIEALAKALLEQTELTGDQAVAIIEASSSSTSSASM